LSRFRLRLLGEAIAKARGSPDLNEADLAAALLAQGLARRELGEMDVARGDFEEALASATQARHHGLAALAHARIGEIVEIAGATSDAHAHFAQSLSLLESSPNDELRRLNEAETYMRIGHAHRREGRLAAAESAVAEATRRYRLLGHGEGLAGALYESAVVAMFQGRREAALARFDEGLDVARRADARTIVGALTTARGGLLQEMGELDEALVHHAEAARVFRELGSRYRETSALYYLATAYLERGDAREAETLLLRALDAAESVGSPRYRALIEGSCAILLAGRGDLEACGRAMERAEKAQTACATEPALTATIAIHALSCSARARGMDTFDAAARAGLERDARALAIAHPSDDSRFALRMLLSCLRFASKRIPEALMVWEEGRGFRLPHARDAVDLSRRSSLKRILDVLARRRFDAPGEAVSLEEIVRAGWPGEQIGTLSALNRAHVALATLRKLGLRDLLLTGAEGYWLNPAVAVRSETGSVESATAAETGFKSV
ncbi:MAG TPA: tetratricopeptide repeat protein, partial [Polyangiaceae bacterium]